MFIRKDNTLKWKWILIGALVTLALVLCGVFWFDELLFDLVNNPSCNVEMPDTSNNICNAALILGTIFQWRVWLSVFAIAVAVFFLYKAIRNEYDFRFAFVKIKNSYVFYIFMSVLAACFATEFAKVLIGRARPLFADPLLFEPLNNAYVFHSMPSGHATIGFAGLVMIGMLFPKMKWATWTLAILIGISRLYIGAHWASDIIFGAFIGMVIADITRAIIKKINAR